MSKKVAVAKASDLQDGDMKQIEIEDLKILLTRLAGTFFALGGECPHQGGPLAEGVLSGMQVTCPWHQSRFHIKTGELTTPPALDSMSRFETVVEGNQVYVILPDKASGATPPAMVKSDPQADSRLFVIVGGGAAGNAAAQKLRQVAYRGRILLISQESRVPYDRTWLSKDYLSGDLEAGSLPLRNEDFYKEADIELMLGKRVAQINAASKTIIFQYNETLTYDALLVATGGKPRELGVPGAQLENVFTLRTPEDAGRIIDAAKQSSEVVVVGASFIGMETASHLKKRGLAVTVVGPGSVPFEKTLGREVGGMLQQMHEENGVSFRLGRQVSRINGEGRVKEVVLDNGDRLPADLVLVGIGVRPATDFLQGVPINPDGSVTVDKYLSLGNDLYAAGDIAKFPYWATNELIRIEHWQLAELHGFTAALNMSGQQEEFRGVPFFWSVQFDTFLYYVGHAQAWDEIIWHGKVQDRNFIAFYVKNGRVLAAASCGFDHGMAYIAELMRVERMPSPEALRTGKTDLFENLTVG